MATSTKNNSNKKNLSDKFEMLEYKAIIKNFATFSKALKEERLFHRKNLQTGVISKAMFDLAIQKINKSLAANSKIISSFSKALSKLKNDGKNDGNHIGYYLPTNYDYSLKDYNGKQKIQYADIFVISMENSTSNLKVFKIVSQNKDEVFAIEPIFINSNGVESLSKIVRIPFTQILDFDLDKYILNQRLNDLNKNFSNTKVGTQLELVNKKLQELDVVVSQQHTQVSKRLQELDKEYAMKKKAIELELKNNVELKTLMKEKNKLKKQAETLQSKVSNMVVKSKTKGQKNAN